jgi:NAD(P)-dependent dehydrogenase (short-subunit alcohol dehydrogenase family)
MSTMKVHSVHHQEKFLNKPIVVTGTSTGIGWGIADVLIRRGLDVFGTVRSRTDGERLQSEFGSWEKAEREDYASSSD